MENSFFPLLISLLLITATVFIILDYDVLHPAFILSSLMSFSVLLATIYQPRWNLYMSVEASLVVLCTVLSFCLGGVYSHYKVCKYVQESILTNLNKNWVKSIHPFKIFFLLVVLILLLVFQYREVYMTSVSLGNNYSVFDIPHMITVNRMAIEKNQLQYSRWYEYRFIIATAITYCSIYYFFQRFFFHAQKLVWGDICLWFPLSIFIPFLILSGGRGGVLELFIYIMTVGALTYGKRNKFTNKVKLKIAFSFLLGGGLCFIAFLAMGLVTGKVTFGGRSPFIILVHYAGLSMPALTQFIMQVPIESHYIGNHSLVGIYSNLRKLGMDLPQIVSFFPFVNWGDIDTNVYTVACRYIMDYGYIGLILIMTILGSFYSAVYDYVRFVNKNYLVIGLYGLIVFPLFVSTNDGFFFNVLLNTSILYKIASFGLIYLFYRMTFAKIISFRRKNDEI